MNEHYFPGTSQILQDLHFITINNNKKHSDFEKCKENALAVPVGLGWVIPHSHGSFKCHLTSTLHSQHSLNLVRSDPIGLNNLLE
jgi:hypothetical protein